MCGSFHMRYQTLPPGVMIRTPMGKHARVVRVEDGRVHVRYADPSMRPGEEGVFPVHLVDSKDIVGSRG